MIDSVVTVPLSPEHSSHFGFYSLLAYAHKLAKDEDLSVLYGINTIGKGDVEKSLFILKRTIEKLHITPHLWWSDATLEFLRIQEAFTHLQTEGIIEMQQRDISRCQCGKVEYLANVELRGGRKTLAQDGHAKCCNTVIVTSSEQVLLTAPLAITDVPQVFPNWAQKEVVEMLGKFSGNRFLVSRSTRRNFSVHVGDADFWIDTDVVWWLYLYWLNQFDIKVKHLVTGASTVQHICKIFLFSSLLKIPTPKTIHMLPKVLFQSVHGINSVEDATERFGVTRVVNALLWKALSQRKIVTLSGTLFPKMSDFASDKHLHFGREHFLKETT